MGWSYVQPAVQNLWLIFIGACPRSSSVPYGGYPFSGVRMFSVWGWFFIIALMFVFVWRGCHFFPGSTKKSNPFGAVCSRTLWRQAGPSPGRLSKALQRGIPANWGFKSMFSPAKAHRLPWVEHQVALPKCSHVDMWNPPSWFLSNAGDFFWAPFTQDLQTCGQEFEDKHSHV